MEIIKIQYNNKNKFKNEFYEEKFQDTLLGCKYYWFILILEKKGKIDLIAPNYNIYKIWVNGIESILNSKKIVSKIQSK